MGDLASVATVIEGGDHAKLTFLVAVQEDPDSSHGDKVRRSQRSSSEKKVVMTCCGGGGIHVEVTTVEAPIGTCIASISPRVKSGDVYRTLMCKPR